MIVKTNRNEVPSSSKKVFSQQREVKKDLKKYTPPDAPPEVKRLRETDKKIQEGLALVSEAVTERTKLLKENFERNTSFSERDETFVGISNQVAKLLLSSLGNQIYKVAKRAEVDNAIAELDVKNKCFLAFNEKE